MIIVALRERNKSERHRRQIETPPHLMPNRLASYAMFPFELAWRCGLDLLN